MTKGEDVLLKLKNNLLIYFSLIPFLFLVTSFLILPFISLVRDSFRGEGGSGFTLIQYWTALINPFYLIAIKNSLLISIYSSIVGLIAAIFATYALTKLPSKLRESFLMFANMTANYAGVPLAFAYIILLGNNGLFTILLKNLGLNLFHSFDLYSWSGLVLVYVYFQIPLAILLLYPTFYALNKDWEDAALLLGATNSYYWRKIGIPILLPGIVGTLSILFANALGAYATAYALVGGNYNLLSIRIGGLISGDIFTRPELASALAVILGIMIVLAILLNEQMKRLVRRDLNEKIS